MAKNWYVVASAARARVLEVADDAQPQGRTQSSFVHVADLVHPQSRQKGSELADDRPGHGVASSHGGGTAYPPRTDPRARERDRFAHEVAQLLDRGVADGRCAGLVLVAGDAFLGELKGHLGAQAAKAVLRTVSSDYTALDDQALAGRLLRGGA